MWLYERDDVEIETVDVIDVIHVFEHLLLIDDEDDYEHHDEVDDEL